MPRQFPGLHGLAFIRRVPAGEVPAFVARMRQHGGLAAFQVHQYEPNPGERFVVQYAEPLPRNADALGMDFASEPGRRKAALAALHSGEARLTPPITLAQARDQGPRSFALLLPVEPPEPALRKAQVFGWVCAPLVMEAVLEDFDTEQGAFAFSLADATPPAEPRHFYSSPAWTGSSTHGPLQGVSLPLYGRKWLVEVQALPPLAAGVRQRDPVEVAFTVAVVSALLALLLHVDQRSLRRERARLASVVDSSHDAIIGHRAQGAITSWNPAAQRLLGWHAQEVMHGDLMALTVPAELRHEADWVRQRVQRGEDVPPFDTVRLDRSGEHVPVSLSVSPIRDPDGRVAGAATTMRDMRAQRAAQDHLFELNATLEQQRRSHAAELEVLAARERAIASSAATAIIATDLAARIVAFNPAAEGMLRLSAAQARDLSALDFFDSDELAHNAHKLPQEVRDNADLLPSWLQEAMQRNGELGADAEERVEWSSVRADGTRFPALLSLSVLRNGHAQALGFLGVVTDLSQLKTMEQKLEQRGEQAEAASRAKGAFLANMSHELRTPLNAVMGLSHLLARMPLPQQALEYARHIGQAGEQLLALTNDVLDLSRIEAGQVQLAHAAFDLGGLLESVRVLVRLQADAKALALEFDVASELPAQVVGDAQRLRQVLLNLLDASGGHRRAAARRHAVAAAPWL